MFGTERRTIPLQGIIFQARDCGVDIRDIISQVGDVGGVDGYIIVGGFQLRAVDGIGTGARQVTGHDIGDFAGGVSAVFGAECRTIPLQGIIFQARDCGVDIRDIISQVGDVGGVGGYIIVGGFQL